MVACVICASVYVKVVLPWLRACLALLFGLDVQMMLLLAWFAFVCGICVCDVSLCVCVCVCVGHTVQSQAPWCSVEALVGVFFGVSLSPSLCVCVYVCVCVQMLLLSGSSTPDGHEE